MARIAQNILLATNWQKNTRARNKQHFAQVSPVSRESRYEENWLEFRLKSRVLFIFYWTVYSQLKYISSQDDQESIAKRFYNPVIFVISYSIITFYFRSKSSISPRPHDFLSLGMKLVQMLHKIGIFCKRAAAVFANKHFRAPLSEAKLVHHAVHACEVRLERTALRERLVASAALKWLYSCVCPYMAL